MDKYQEYIKILDKEVELCLNYKKEAELPEDKDKWNACAWTVRMMKDAFIKIYGETK